MLHIKRRGLHLAASVPKLLCLKMLLSVDDDTLGWAGTINVP